MRVVDSFSFSQLNAQNWAVCREWENVRELNREFESAFFCSGLSTCEELAGWITSSPCVLLLSVFFAVSVSPGFSFRIDSIPVLPSPLPHILFAGLTIDLVFVPVVPT